MSQYYEKINWKNRVDTGNKYKITNNGDETKTIKYAGEVKQAGTPIDADNLNHMDEGIYQNNKDIKDLDEKKLNKNSPDYLPIKYFFKTSDLNTDFMLSPDDPNKVIFCCYNNAISLNNSPKLLATPCQIIMERLYNGTGNVPDTIEQTFIGLITGGASEYSICAKYHRLYRGSTNTNAEWTEWKEINTDIGREISDISGLTESLENKVDNTNSGAVDLLEKLQETETVNVQTSNKIIIQDLKNYIKVPITKLWDWIKSNLAKVATSGSYTDLSDKPDIPIIDSSFSEDSTNAVAGNVILSALNSKANKTELQSLSNQVSNKADINHTHAYLPLAGGTMDNDSTIKLPYPNGRSTIVKGSGIEFTMPTTNDGWASGIMFSKKDGTTRAGNIGAYGNENDLIYYFIGPVYNNPLIKILPTGQTTISSSAYPLILKRTTGGDPSDIKFENSNGALGYIGFNSKDEALKRWDSAGTHEYSVLDTGNAFSTTTPKANGTASVGTATTVSRSDHVHPLQTSVSGNAGSATALTSKNVGSNVVPTYFDANGKPAVCKYTLGDASTKTIKTASAISNTNWADLATGQKYIPDMAFISYWNGAINDQGGSNLKYCNKGAFGIAATKDVDTTVTSGSTKLVTSGGVSTALANKVSTTSNTIVPTWWCGTDTANTTGYYNFMTVTMSQYEDFNMTLLITNEFASRYIGIFNTHIRCDSGTTTNAPDHMSWLVRRGWAADAIIAVVSGLTVKYYINQVTPQFSGICFKALSVSSRHGNSATYTTVSSTAPTTGLKASATSRDDSTVSHASNADNSTKWSGWTADLSTNNTADTYLLVATNNNKIQHRLSTSFAAASHSHSPATTSAAGYMSAADKTKLNGIATGANNYSLPTASSTLGGVKTTSTVTSTSGYTACPIISGVPYYKDTNTTYSDFVKSGSTAAHGLVPKPPTTAGTTKYLREDGTWAVPPNTTYTSLKNPYAITIQGNGTVLTNGTYDGSAAKTVNITPTNIGACKATDGIVNNSFKVTKSSGATLTTTAAADKITMSTDKKLYIGDDSGFASSTKIYGTFDHAQTVLYSSTSSSTLTSVSIANLFTEYSLIFINIQGSKTYHSHVIPLKYLKSKGSIIFKDAGSSSIIPLNLLYVSDTEMRWFEYQGQGTETYSSVQVIKIY